MVCENKYERSCKLEFFPHTTEFGNVPCLFIWKLWFTAWRFTDEFHKNYLQKTCLLNDLKLHQEHLKAHRSCDYGIKCIKSCKTIWFTLHWHATTYTGKYFLLWYIILLWYNMSDIQMIRNTEASKRVFMKNKHSFLSLQEEIKKNTPRSETDQVAM